MKIPIDKIKINSRMRMVDEYKIDELAESIANIGLLHPIVIDTDCNLISGKHRILAHKKLNKPEIECNIIDFEYQKGQLAEIDENLIRANLNDIELGQHFIERDKILNNLGLLAKQGDNRYTTNRGEIISPLQTNDDIARKIGFTKRSIQLKKQIAKNLDKSVSQDLSQTEYAYNTTGLLKLSRCDKDIQKEVSRRLSQEKNADIETCIKDVNRDSKKQNILNNLSRYKETKEGCTLYHSRFQEVSIKSNSIDMIWCDPPYARDFLYLYDDLGKMAGDVLKEGASCFVYCGTNLIPEIIDIISKYLNYYWIIAIQLAGNKARNGKIFVEYKPILWFYKGNKPNIKENITDCIKSTIPEYNKVLHPWEQSTEEPTYYIQHITEIGDTILDIMMGTGTTGVSAIKTGRKFIGIEKDKETFEIAQKRLSSI